jgi:C4-dicarboxylate-specific signal transduction histidine kinase
LQIDHEFKDIGRKALVFHGREILQPPPNGETILLVIEDTTERTELQRLELFARERTLASERALRETETELARISRALALGEIATSIAHEVNQPLAGVVTNAEAALRWLGSETPNLPEARDSLSLIVRDGSRAGEVIRRIRKFLTKAHYETTRLDINEAIRDAATLLSSELTKRQITLRSDLSTGVPPVVGDFIQLQQVILNLIMNGAEAMISTDGPKELTVKSQKSAEGGALVSIRDCGIGAKPQDIHRMFDAFYTTKPDGIGIGLSISRSIIEAHGGRIWAEAAGGPGLTVTFSLPADGAVQQSPAAGNSR